MKRKRNWTMRWVANNGVVVTVKQNGPVIIGDKPKTWAQILQAK